MSVLTKSELQELQMQTVRERISAIITGLKAELMRSINAYQTLDKTVFHYTFEFSIKYIENLVSSLSDNFGDSFIGCNLSGEKSRIPGIAKYTVTIDWSDA